MSVAKLNLYKGMLEPGPAPRDIGRPLCYALVAAIFLYVAGGKYVVGMKEHDAIVEAIRGSVESYVAPVTRMESCDINMTGMDSADAVAIMRGPRGTYKQYLNLRKWPYSDSWSCNLTTE